jgi:trypsin
MKFAIVFCMFLSAASALPKHPLLAFVGDGDIKDWRVVGGRPANSGEFPYQCALLRVSGSATSLTCGCWIINARTIGTAAHCIDGGQPSQFMVRCGGNQHASGGQLMSVAKVTAHPSYNPSTINNDIGVIQLSSPLTFGPTVSPVTLPASGSDPTDGTPVTATGWGRTSTNGPIPADLQTVALTINGRSQCQSTWGAGITITTGMICAGRSHAGQGICNGDSGGALVTGSGASPTIVGTMSFRTSLGCAYGSYPEVYARIANYIDFINQNTVN